MLLHKIVHPDEEYCKSQFINTTYVDKSGLIVVKFPFKQDAPSAISNLGDSYHKAT